MKAWAFLNYWGARPGCFPQVFVYGCSWGGNLESTFCRQGFQPGLSTDWQFSTLNTTLSSSTESPRRYIKVAWYMHAYIAPSWPTFCGLQDPTRNFINLCGSAGHSRLQAGITNVSPWLPLNIRRHYDVWHESAATDSPPRSTNLDSGMQAWLEEVF